MESRTDKLLMDLSPAIDAECDKLRSKRRERMLGRIFASLCLSTLLFPAVFVFLGISLAWLIVPTAFAGLCLLALSPILFIQKGSVNYEQVR